MTMIRVGNTVSTMGWAALLASAFLATGCCRGGGGGGEASGDPAKTSVPVVTPPANTKGTSAATPPQPTAGTVGDARGIPAIPGGSSPPPSVSEWSAASDVNQAGANAKPRDCEIKIVREWMKIHCEGNVKSVEKVEGIGKEGVDHFKQVTPGKVADFVVKLKKGGSIKMRILRDPQSATLFTNWSGNADRPGTVVMNIFAG